MTKVETHKNICAQLNDTYERKNHDYGDSFAQLRQRQPNAILVRIFDKYLRLETLLGGKTAKVKDESIDDTLVDLANYCIMELVERRAERPIDIIEQRIIEDEQVEAEQRETHEKLVERAMAELYKIECAGKGYCSKCSLSSFNNGMSITCGDFCQQHPQIALDLMQGKAGK